MNENNRKAIIDHIDKIEQYAKTDPWLMSELRRRFGGFSDTRIDEIYEYCIERVIREQAEQFYKDFPIKEIVPSLVDDFCRMERYKRDDNFGDYCLATFQQVECITNWFCQSPKFIELYSKKINDNSTIEDANGNILSIGHLIIQSNYEERFKLPLMKLYFNERLRVVLYFVYYNQNNPIKVVFDSKYNNLNKLYQCRNLNHRGGETTSYQENIIEGILPHRYLYYLKFNGLLVDYVERISQIMAKKEDGTISNKAPSAAYIKTKSGAVITIEANMKLWGKAKKMQIGENVIIDINTITNELIDIKLK